MVLASFVLVFVSFGLPAIDVFLLFYNHQLLSDLALIHPESPHFLEQRKPLERIRSIFSPLFGDHRRHREWFGLVVMGKLLLHCIILVLLDPYPLAQSCLILSLYSTYVFTLYFNPYEQLMLLKFDLLFASSDVLTLLVPVIVQCVGPSIATLMQWILISVQGFVFVAFVARSFFLLKQQFVRLFWTKLATVRLSKLPLDFSFSFSRRETPKSAKPVAILITTNSLAKIPV
eukprot:c837_g1_i1.p1 GENE.c837_g1_i1~~c837_g1_i1.p1  ORF type:complete len:231 (-),score=31.57 c837_g1_i1:4-696(-)